MADARCEDPDADLADRGSASVSSSMVVGCPVARRTAARVAVTPRPGGARRACRQVWDVGRPPHRAVDDGLDVVIGGDAGEAALDRLPRDADRDRTGDRAQVADRRVERPGRQAGVGHGRGQRPGGEQEHPVGDRARLRRDRAEAEPGKTKTLFAWPISRRRPSTSTASNGEPVATRARPSVQRRTSTGVASETEVGFESGRTMGRSVPAAIARRTASSNVPPTPVVPTRTVGRTRSIVSTRPGNSVVKP